MRKRRRGIVGTLGYMAIEGTLGKASASLRHSLSPTLKTDISQSKSRTPNQSGCGEGDTFPLTFLDKAKE